MRARLGVSEIPVTLNGPVIARSRRCGSVVKPYASAMLVLAIDQSSGAIRSCTGPSRRRMTAMRTGGDADRLGAQVHAVGVRCRHPAVDVEQRDARAVDRDLDLLGSFGCV